MITTDLIEDLQTLIQTSPRDFIERVCLVLDNSSTWPEVQSRILGTLHIPIVRKLVQSVMGKAAEQGKSPSEIAFALRLAGSVENHHRKETQLELVWTGPTFQPYHFRRTDEVLFEMIENAARKLTLVSFALYKIDRLSNALSEAINRGVAIRMFMEVEKTKSPDIHKLYGGFLANNISFYIWSDSQRLRSNNGRQGVLHAKTVVADSQQLFISSANLTEYAMSINIELGLLVGGGKLPSQVEHILDDYIVRNVFTQLVI